MMLRNRIAADEHLGGCPEDLGFGELAHQHWCTDARQANSRDATHGRDTLQGETVAGLLVRLLLHHLHAVRVHFPQRRNPDGHLRTRRIGSRLQEQPHEGSHEQ